MRVLHFCQTFSALSETFIYDLVSELERQGVDDHVVTLQHVNADTRPFLKVHHIPKQGRYHPERLCRRALVELGVGNLDETTWPATRRDLARVAEKIKPDVVHAHFGPMGVLIAPIARRLNIPLVVTFNGYDATSLAQSEYWNGKYRELWPDTAAAVGVSEHICNRVLQLGAPKNKLHRISNGVDLSKLTYRNPAERFDGNNVRCLFVARLVEKKGPMILVRAVKKAITLIPQTFRLTLDMVGDGPLMPSLRAFVTAEGLSDVVRIHGALTHNEVTQMLMRAHLYVQHCVTSRDGDCEGQGVSLIEASACGLPIVSTRSGGVPEVVADGLTGFLVEENDFESMGIRIASVASSPELWGEMGWQGRTRVESSMNLRTQAQAWIDLYRGSIQQALQDSALVCTTT